MEELLNDLGMFFVRLSMPSLPTDFTFSTANDAFNTQLLRQLECPVCLNTCMPPIYMCSNGHNVCANCQSLLNECCECHLPEKSTLRCEKLEKMSELVKLPCKNNPQGCMLNLNKGEMVEHLPKCNYSFLCYVCGDFKGSSKALNDHVLSMHGSYHLGCLSDSSGKKLSTVIPSTKLYHDNLYFYMVTFDDDVFWLEKKYTSSTGIFSMRMRIVSHEDLDAARYFYSVKFKPCDKLNELQIFYQAGVEKENSNAGNMLFVLPPCITDITDDGKIWFTIKMTQKKL